MKKIWCIRSYILEALTLYISSVDSNNFGKKERYKIIYNLLIIIFNFIAKLIEKSSEKGLGNILSGYLAALFISTNFKPSFFKIKNLRISVIHTLL